MSFWLIFKGGWIFRDVEISKSVEKLDNICFYGTDYELKFPTRKFEILFKVGIAKVSE